MKKNYKKKVVTAKYLQEVLQLGNFIIKKKGDGEFSYIHIVTTDGGWMMDFREDTFKYGWILMLAAEERYHEILRAWITVSYHVTMCSPDPQFLDDTIKALQGLNQRALEMSENDKKEQVTDVAEKV